MRASGRRMKVFQITRPGLTAIGALTMMLWGCFVGERMLMRHSAANEYLAMRSMRELRLKRTFMPAAIVKPVAAPVAVKVG